MRIVPNKFLTLLVLSLYCDFAIAAPIPPAPIPPPPPGLPIDSNLIMLASVSVLYGLYKIYYNKKASI